MTKQVQLRRGTTAEHAVFTGAVGELTIDTTLDVAVVHDGLKAGGYPLVGAGATQTITNKVAIGIGTTNATSPLTVFGNSYVTGVSTFNTAIISNEFVSGISTISSLDVTYQRVTGISTVESLRPRNLSVSGVSTFAGIGSTTSVKIGSGNTDFIVEGNARITGILTVGSSSITLDPSADTIRANSAILSQLTVSSTEKETFSLNTTVASNIGVGSTGITLSSVVGVQTGDKLTISGVFDKVPILGFSTVSSSPYAKTFLTTTVPKLVGQGSTVIGIANSTGVSIGNSISISGILSTVSIVGFTTILSDAINTVFITSQTSGRVSSGSTIIPLNALQNPVSVGNSLSITGIFDNVPVVGVGSTVTSLSDITITTTSISTTVSSGSTVINVSTTSGVSVGSSISISGIFNYAPIVGITTASVTPYNSVFNTTSISTTVSVGSTIIGIANSTGVSVGSSISISGIFNNVRVLGFTTVSTGSTLTNVAITSIGSTVSVGSTVISVASTSNVIVGDILDVGGFITHTAVVGILTSSVLIGAAGTSSSSIPSGTTAAFFRTTPTSSTAVLIGAGFTYNNTISTGTTVTFSGVTSTTPAVLVGDGVTYNGIISAGTAVTFTNLTSIFSPAVLIGSAYTYSSPINQNTTVSISSVSTLTYPAVLIPSSSAYNGFIPKDSTVSISSVVSFRDQVSIASTQTYNGTITSGTNATIQRLTVPESSLNVTNLNISGIATFNGLKFPSVDGVNGQVIRTDGNGNLTFGAGGGGGSEVIIRVSKETGDDANDGVLLPVSTIKKATQLASFIPKSVTILVETGVYEEENPIILYDNTNIIGDSLRNITLKPLNAGQDFLKVRSSSYVTGFSFNDYTDQYGVPQHTYDYAVAFDDPYNDLLDRTGYAATTTETIVNATYDNGTGITTITTSNAHEFIPGISVRITGLGWTCGYDETGISTFVYNNTTGISTITLLSTPGNLSIGNEIFLFNLPFSCAAQHAGVTTTIFPYAGLGTYGAVYPIIGINTALKTLTIQGGISTIPHVYVGYSTVAVSTARYNNVVGIITVTTSAAHGLVANDNITLSGLAFTCNSGAGSSTFPSGRGPYGYTFKVSTATTNTFTAQVGVSTIVHYYNSGGFVRKVPTLQKVVYYPESHVDGRIDFGVVGVGTTNTVFQIGGKPSKTGTASTITHYFAKGGTARLTKPIITKSPYVQNCSILSALGGNGILVDGNKVASPNYAAIQALAETPVEGDPPEFGKSMVAATFTMVSFGGIGWRTINDGYAQVVSCFQIFCRYASLCQSGGYLSITNSATNFGNFSLRSTGFSPKSFRFDRGRVAATGVSGGLQTLKVIGLGRSDQQLYVLRFFDDNFVDRTSNFKPLVVSATVNVATGINTVTSVVTIPGHPFSNLDSVIYQGNEDANPQQVIKGLVSGNQYYIGYIDASSFRLYEDEGLAKLISLGSTFVGVNTFTKNNQEFVLNEIIDSHTSYQTVSLASTSSTLKFVSGRQVTQSVSGGNAVGYALTYNSSTRQLVVSVETTSGTRRNFSSSGGTISDHSASPISIGVTAVAGITTYYTVEFKVESTTAGNVIAGISSLPENYRCHLHRPSIINSSSHTWEYSGSGIDYNALPQNGGKTDPDTEQVSELGGRVYASGTNELGDFKIGNQITAYNRTGNIIFNNKVTIGELASIRLSLSGGVAISEFSTDTNLGDTEVGGPQNYRVSTQLAVRSFLANRLGTFIDKTVSTNAVPGAVVQLNTNGQINSDLIPPKIVNYNITNVGGGRTILVNKVPAANILQGDTVVEPTNSYLLVNDVVSQYLILDSTTDNYAFNNGDTVTSALSSTVTGIVTAPPQGVGIGTSVGPYVGYGTTGLVKGTILTGSITNGGSGYTSPGIYTAFFNSITGIGTSGYATVTVGAAGTVTSVSLIGGGRYYAAGNIVNVPAANLGGRSGGADFQYTIGSVETRLYLKLTANQKFTGSSALSDFIADSRAGVATTSLTVGYAVTFTPTDTNVSGSIDFTNNRIVVGVNSLSSGDPVVYDSQGGNMITAAGLGINDQNTYYVKKVGAGTSVELHRNYQLNDSVDLTGSGSGTHRLVRQVVNVMDSRLVLVGHGYSTGTPIRVTGGAPTGVTTGAFYYTGSVTTNSFSLHLTQFDALSSVNGVTFNAVGFASTSSGNITFTRQNVKYSSTVNTSSTDINNWSLLARSDIDAANIVSGIINSSRLGGGSANSDTFLSGNSTYQKVVKSVGIGTTQPLGISSYSSADFAPGGVGVNTYYGNISLTVNRSQGTLDLYSTLGVARFKTSTFSVDTDGNVSIKNSATGDVDAATLGGQSGSYYLNVNNHQGTIPITRGGTGLTGLPSNGAILIGNGSAYSLTTTPTFQGTVTIAGSSGANQFKVGQMAASSRAASVTGPGIRELFRVSQDGLTTGGFFTIYGTRGNFVHGSTWSWSSTHPGNGMLTMLSSISYSNITLYLDVNGSGDVIISADIGGTTTMTVSVHKTAGADIDFSAWDTSRSSPASGYTRYYTQTTISLGFITNNLRAATITETSDIKVKKNIVTIENALDKVSKLRGVEFDTVDGDKHKIGLIAQEVEEVIPEVVYSEGDSLKGVSYGNLVGLLIESIKELKSEINDLKNQNEYLVTKINDLTNK